MLEAISVMEILECWETRKWWQDNLDDQKEDWGIVMSDDLALLY